MKKKQAKNLIDSYIKKETTPEEDALVERGFLNDLQNSRHLPSKPRIRQATERIGTNLAHHISHQNTGTKIKMFKSRIAVAASILLMLTAGTTYFLFEHNLQKQPAKIIAHTIVPGSRKAYLTLANGKIIILNKANNGLLINQGGTAINRKSNGELIYDQENKPGSNEKEMVYNSVTVPGGAEYQIITLPDGTKAWINSESSLRFPVSFSGSERKVELSGEAYFEVAHDAAKPFRVVTEKQTVEVLGTHFNINAYADEPDIKTTLIEGKVKITMHPEEHSQLLSPGEQASLSGDIFSLKTIDTDPVVAWTKGQFSFEGQHIEAIMRTICRWYNVKVIYQGQIPDDTFVGETSRFADVTAVLNILQLTGKVQFKIEGNEIIVSKPTL